MQIVFNGSIIKTEEDFHNEIEKALKPEVYGRNLDALYDVLTGMGNAEIVFKGAETFKQALGDYAKNALDVFRDAAKENKSITLKIFI